MKIGGAWIQKDKDGNVKKDKNDNSYLSCSISIPFYGNVYFMMFKNSNKEKETHPDYSIVWNEQEKKDDDSPPF